MNFLNINGYKDLEDYIELKLRGDDHNNRFSNGLTLTGSESTRNMHLEKANNGIHIYTNPQCHQVELHRRLERSCVEYYTVFKNNGNEPAIIELLSSFAVKNIKGDKIHRFQSFWSAEGRHRVDSVADLHLEPSWSKYGLRIEKFGQIGSMPVRKYFPIVVVEDSENGSFTGFQIYCSSSWQIEILCSDDTLTITGGLADRDYGHWFKEVKPDEEFTTPKAVMAKGTSLEEVCDFLIDFQKPHIASVDNEMPIAFNEFCTTWGNPTIGNIKKIANTLKGKGIKYFIIDCGWYAGEKGWELAMGDWVPNKEMFPNGLIEAADYIRSCGMIPGIWFELEIVGRSSKAFYYTDYLLKKDGYIITTGNRRFWNMTDPWVNDYLTDKVIKTLKECGFGYLKVDYNDTIGIGCDGFESLGEGLRRNIEATQLFLQKIQDSVPDIVIENCSSGGHRLEPSMMQLVSQASFSDAHECLSIPVIAANLHRLIKPQQSQIWAVVRKDDDSRRLMYTLVNTFLGRMCLSGDVLSLSDAQWEIIGKGMSFYNDITNIIKVGHSKRFGPEIVSYNSLKGWQAIVRSGENKKRILVVIHVFEHIKDELIEFEIPDVEEYTIVNRFSDNTINLDIQKNKIRVNRAVELSAGAFLLEK